MPTTLTPETVEEQRQEAICDLSDRYPSSAWIVQSYLDSSTRYTIGSWTTLTLAGKAKKYAVHYEDAMWSCLHSLRSAGLIEPCRSAHGGQSWRWVEPPAEQATAA